MRTLLVGLVVATAAACGPVPEGQKPASNTPSESAPSAPEQKPAEVEKTDGTRDPRSALVLAPGDARPPCDDKGKGALIYVIEGAQFEYCSGTAWTAIDLKGAAGAPGVAGVNGTAGTNGTSGINGADGVGGNLAIAERLEDCGSGGGSGNEMIGNTMTSGGNSYLIQEFNVTKFTSGDYFFEFKASHGGVNPVEYDSMARWVSADHIDNYPTVYLDNEEVVCTYTFATDGVDCQPNLGGVQPHQWGICQ